MRNYGKTTEDEGCLRGWGSRGPFILVEGPPFLWLSAGCSAHTLPSSLPQVFLQLRGGLRSPSGSIPVYRLDSALSASALITLLGAP